MAEGGGLLNRYTDKTVSGVRIPPPPPPGLCPLASGMRASWRPQKGALWAVIGRRIGLDPALCACRAPSAPRYRGLWTGYHSSSRVAAATPRRNQAAAEARFIAALPLH